MIDIARWMARGDSREGSGAIEQLDCLAHADAHHANGMMELVAADGGQRRDGVDVNAVAHVER
jgi:hypothetical protein